MLHWNWKVFLLILFAYIGLGGIFIQAGDDKLPMTDHSSSRSSNSSRASGLSISYNPSQYLQSTQYLSSIKHYSSFNEGSLYTQLTQKLKFAPYLQVNPNRGSFQTRFSIPLPPHLGPLPELVFSYDSENTFHEGYGYGWKLNLPFIGENNRGRPYTNYYSQGLSNGELKEVEDYALKREWLNSESYQTIHRLLKEEGIHLESAQWNFYRPLVENGYHLYRRYFNEENSGWVVSSPQGEIWIFDSHGRPMKALNLFGQGISFRWYEGHLSSIHEGAGRKAAAAWVVQFYYSAEKLQDLPQYVHGMFMQVRQGLESLEMIHQNGEKRKFNFHYRKGYLTLVKAEKGLRPLFQGRYGTPQSELSEEISPLRYHDDKTPVMTSEGKVSYESAPVSDVHQTILTDLNGDHILDKLIFSYEKRHQDLKEFLSEDSVYKGFSQSIKRGREIHYLVDPAFKANLPGVLSDLNGGKPQYIPEFKVLYGLNTNDGRPASMAVTPFDQLERYPLNPFIYKISFETKRHDEETLLEVPQVKIVPNSIRLVDLNGDSRKDLIYCLAADDLDHLRVERDGPPSNKEKKRYFSNLILSVLKLIGTPEVEQMKFSYAFRLEGQFPKGIYYQNGQTEVRPPKFQPEPEVRHLPGYRHYDQFKCHQYSVFHDFNHDGIVDVLSGSTLFLRGTRGEVIGKELSYPELQSLFSGNIIGTTRRHTDIFIYDHDFLDFEWNDFFLADVDGDGRLDLIQGKDLQVNPATGRLHLFLEGRTLIYDPRPRREFLTQIDSPFGGDIQVDYHFDQGQWVVKSLQKRPRGKQVPTLIRYAFSGKSKDDFTGHFIGFQQIEEQKEIGAAPYFQKQILTRKFFRPPTLEKDRYYLSRAILHGLEKENSLQDQKGNLLERAIFQWSILELDAERVLPHLAKVKREQTRPGENAPFLSFQKTMRAKNFDHGLPLYEEVDDYDVLNNKRRTMKRQYILYPENYLRVLRQEGVAIDQQEEKAKIILKSNSLGQIKEIQYGSDEQKRTWHFTYDLLGRKESSKRQDGFFQQYSYHGRTPLIHTMTDSQGSSTADYHLLSGDLTTTITPLGARYEYTYSPEGLLLKATMQKDESSPKQEYYRLEMPHIPCPAIGVCTLPQQIEQKYQDKVTTLFLDGFGRVEQTSSQMDQQHYLSGLHYFGEDEEVWRMTPPQMDKQAEGQEEKIWRSASGEELIRQTLDGDSVEMERKGNCTLTYLNQILEQADCQDGFGHLTFQQIRGQEVHFEFNSLGELTEISPLGYRYHYDSYGQMIKSQGNMKLPLSPSWNAVESSYHPQKRLYRNHQTRQEIQFNEGGQIISIQHQLPAHPNDLTEKMNYTKGLIQNHSYLNTQGQEVLVKKFGPYDGFGHPRFFEIGPLRLNFDYDHYGRLLQKQVLYQGKEVTLKRYHYRHNQLVKMEPLAEGPRFDAQLNLKELSYLSPSSLSLKKEFRVGSTEVLKTQLFQQMNPNAEKNALWYEELTRNKRQQVERRQTYSKMSPLQSPLKREDLFNYNPETDQLETEETWPKEEGRRDALIAFKRDDRGRVESLGAIPLTWNEENLSGVAGQSFYYDHQGSLLAACPQGVSFQIFEEKCLIKVDSDLILYQGHVLQLEKFQGQVIGVSLDKEFYPLVSDQLGSIRAMLSPDGKEILWNREYSAWGQKKVHLNEKSVLGLKKIKNLEEWVVWSYAGLLEIPGVNEKIGKNLYWSQSRVYSPDLREWLSVDPLVKMNPQSLVGMPGNWKSTEYASGDPVNLFDITGHAVFGKRPLSGPLRYLEAGNAKDNKNNTEIRHEHLFFHDGKMPSNIGFTRTGVFTEKNPDMGQYRMDLKNYRDDIMRIAVNNVNSTIGEYKFLGNNCQDWSDSVRAEYNRISPYFESNFDTGYSDRDMSKTEQNIDASTNFDGWSA